MRAVGAEVADAAAIDAALRFLELVDDLHRPHLWRAGDCAGREAGGQRIDEIVLRIELADDVRDDVHDVGIVLEEELVGDLHGADLAPPGRRRCGRGRAASGARRAPWDRSAARRRVPCRGSASRRACGCRRWGGWSPRPCRPGPGFPGSIRRRRSRRNRGSTCRARGWCGAARGRARSAGRVNSASKRWLSTTWKMSPARMYSLARATIAAYSATVVLLLTSMPSMSGRFDDVGQGAAEPADGVVDAGLGAFPGLPGGDAVAHIDRRGEVELVLERVEDRQHRRPHQDRVGEAEAVRIGVRQLLHHAGPCRSRDSRRCRRRSSGRPSGTSIWLSATSARSASSGGCVTGVEGVGLEPGVAVDAGLAVLDLEDDVGERARSSSSGRGWRRPGRFRAGRCSAGPRRASGRCRRAFRGRRRRGGTGSAPARRRRPRRSAGTHLRQPSFIARSWCRVRAAG